MNITFGSTELQTLNELQEIAKKHNMGIHMGYRSDSGFGGYSIMCVVEVNEKVIKCIKDNEHLCAEAIFSSSSVWFELFDRENRDYHTMTYAEEELNFDIEGVSEMIESCKTTEEKTAMREFIDEWSSYEFEFGEEGADSAHIVIAASPTIITGFGEKDLVKDYRVYRSGMALKYFGDLVCDFLGEPRIERVY